MSDVIKLEWIKFEPCPGCEFQIRVKHNVAVTYHIDGVRSWTPCPDCERRFDEGYRKHFKLPPKLTILSE